MDNLAVGIIVSCKGGHRTHLCDSPAGPVLAGGDHLMNGLASHAQLPGQIGLRETLGQQSVDQSAALASQFPRGPGVINRGGPNLLQVLEDLGVSRGLDPFPFLSA